MGAMPKGAAQVWPSSGVASVRREVSVSTRVTQR
jgi:hypothetical protein